MKVNKTRLLLSLLVGAAIVLKLVFISPLIEHPDDIYSNTEAPKDLIEQFRFEDVTQKWGLEYRHFENYNQTTTKNLFFIFPSVSLFDFNGDGFLDIFYSGGERNFLYIRIAEGVYEESAASYGLLGNDRKKSLPSKAILADIDNDGDIDLYLGAVGNHRLYYREGQKFVDKTELLNSYTSVPDAVSFIDFNQDGLLDVVVGNFLNLDKANADDVWYIPRRYGNKLGGANHLLIQNKDGKFNLAREVDFISHSYTHAIGISDVNRDGFPDIFFANDYDKDEMFLNIKGKKVVDVTQKFIPKRWHGNSGMNADFVDYNHDGLIDLYVTYIYKPPFYRTYNVLWEKQEDNTFKQVSWEKPIGKCGFSWGAKFVDFNVDGELDLIVVNGKDRDSRALTEEMGKSFWYERTQLVSMPKFLNSYLSKYEKERDGVYYHTSGFERDCLFVKHKGEYYDIAKDLDLTDKQEGRGVAIGDLNNDGLQDAVIVNTHGRSKVYLNKSKVMGNWISFQLQNKFGSIIPVGAELRLKQSRGPDLVSEYYPISGFRVQNDHRPYFTMSKDSEPLELLVKWPGNKEVKSYKNLKINSLNIIREMK